MLSKSLDPEGLLLRSSPLSLTSLRFSNESSLLLRGYKPSSALVVIVTKIGIYNDFFILFLFKTLEAIIKFL